MKVKKYGKKQIQLDCGDEVFTEGTVKNGWFGATPKVYEYATKTIRVDDEVEVTLKANHNPQWSPVIVKIKKVGSGTSTPVTTSASRPTSVAVETPVKESNGIKVQLWRDDKRVEVEEDGKLMLYNCSDAVYNFGKKAIPVGTAVVLDITDGVITKITKKHEEQKVVTNTETVHTNNGYTYSEYMKPRTYEERAEMMAESIAKTTAETVKVLEGQIDIEALPDAIAKIYDVYYNIITAKAEKLLKEYFGKDVK